MKKIFTVEMKDSFYRLLGTVEVEAVTWLEALGIAASENYRPCCFVVTKINGVPFAPETMYI